MANSAVILLLGSLALLALSRHRVSAGARNHIEPIVSNVYYLQDYCSLPSDTNLEQKYRHRRSSKDSDEDSDEDHDHDHDHDTLERIAGDIHKTWKYYAKEGYRSLKKQIKRELELRNKWKQIFLDPVSQPSIVVRLWRPHDEYYQQHHRILEEAAANLPIKCNILLHMSSNVSSAALGTFANSTLGTVVNFLKLNKKPWLNNYRLRIVTSDPNMTQYWLQGRRLISAASTANSTNAQSTSSAQLPVAVDLVTNPKMYPEPLQKEELEQISSDNGKWLLIELETLNQAASSETTEGPESSNNVNSKLQQTTDETELVINLYAKSTNTVTTSTAPPQGASGNNSQNAHNVTVSITYQCPIGTFDCAGDGSQCIPSGLRCNGEDNCGNRFDELFNCGSVNLYYIFGADSSHPAYDLSSDGFWFAVRILVLLFLIILLMYSLSLLCRCCCDSRTNRGMLINGKSPMIYVRSAKGAAEPLLSSGSSSSSGGGGGFGATTGRAMKSSGGFQFAGGAPPPSGPPPSYFGNQSDNQKSNVNEYIYVNNNYGQPQGSTTVNTSVQPSRDIINGGGPSAPPQYQLDQQIYPNIQFPNYGGTQKS